MAVRTVPQYFDDLDNTELTADEVTTVRFSLNGRHYEIDLSQANADKLHQEMAPWVNAARRDTGKAGTAKTRNTPAARKAKLDKIRAWAADNGYDVNPRGRVANHIEAAYDAAH